MLTKIETFKANSNFKNVLTLDLGSRRTYHIDRPYMYRNALHHTHRTFPSFHVGS